MEEYKFTEDNLSLWPYRDSYLVDILNGEYSLEEAREDLFSLIERNRNEFN